jgi:Tfp pilus assembly protein PilF
VAGLDAVREKLARMALAAGDMIEADYQADAALKVDPNNESLRRLKAEIKQREAEQLGRVPSPDMLRRAPALKKRRLTSPRACKMPSSFTKWASMTRRRPSLR